MYFLPEAEISCHCVSQKIIQNNVPRFAEYSYFMKFGSGFILYTCNMWYVARFGSILTI